MATGTTTFWLRIKPVSKMLTPIMALQFMFDYASLNPRWSAFEIHRKLFQVKIGEGNKVLALFNLIPCILPGGILKDISQFNAVNAVDFEMNLREFNHILIGKQNFSEHMIMYHVNDNDSISIIYDDDTNKVIPLRARKQSERLAQFSTHALHFQFCVTIESSLLRDRLLRFFIDHYQNEDTVMIEVTKENVVFFIGVEKKPELSIRFTTEECDIKMSQSILRYEATVTWDNRKSLGVASEQHNRARLHGYQNPHSSDHYITWSFIFEPDDYDTSSYSSHSSMHDIPTVPDIDNIASSSASAPMQMQGDSRVLQSGATTLGYMPMQVVPNYPVQDVMDNDGNLIVPDVDADVAHFDLQLPGDQTVPDVRVLPANPIYVNPLFLNQSQPIPHPQVQMPEASNVQDVTSSDDDNLIVPNINASNNALQLQGDAMALTGDHSSSSDHVSSPNESDVSDISSTSPILQKAVFDQDVGASSSSSTRSQVKDIRAIGGIMFVYYPKEVAIANAE